MEPRPFEGFSKEAISFINEWRTNNSRDWFQPRKSEYEKLIKQPALCFIHELGSKLKLLSRDITFDLGHNGSYLRIYRDVRFSHDKTPYNPNIRVVFWEGPRKRTENPGFYIKIDENGAALFAGMHTFVKDFLHVYRDAVVNPELGPALEKAIQSVSESGDYEIGGEHYKRVPRGYEPDHQRAELLKYNGLYAWTAAVPAKEVHSPELVDICFQHCVNMRPIQEWLVNMLAKKL
jgi:uncharacterized protein (TIGR02453 family)